MNFLDFRLERGGDKVDENTIAAFEKTIKLPEDYKEIVVGQFNGGSPEGSSITGTYYTLTTAMKKGLEDQRITVSLLSLYSFDRLEPDFCPAYSEDIEEFGSQVEEKYKKLLLIGNGEDSYFMLGIAEENFGQVFLWVGHDEEEYNPHKVADSFLDFIDKLEIHHP